MKDKELINSLIKLFNEALSKKDSNSANDNTIVDNSKDDLTIGNDFESNITWAPKEDYTVNRSIKDNTYTNFLNVTNPSTAPLGQSVLSIRQNNNMSNKLIKKGYATKMTYEVSDLEKRNAEKTLIYFDKLIDQLKNCDDALNSMSFPFTDDPNPNKDKILKEKNSFEEYKNIILEKFNKFKKVAFQCFVSLQIFSFDTQVLKLNKSFVLCVGDVEKQVNRFIDLFADLKSAEFATSATSAIKLIKKEIAQLEQLIEDRIKNHIQSNILARNWIDNVSDELQEKVEKKIPLTVELVENRDKKN